MIVTVIVCLSDARAVRATQFFLHVFLALFGAVAKVGPNDITDDGG